MASVFCWVLSLKALKPSLAPSLTSHLQATSKSYQPCLQSISRTDYFSPLSLVQVAIPSPGLLQILVISLTALLSPTHSPHSLHLWKPKLSPSTPWFQTLWGPPYITESQPKSIPGLQALGDMPWLPYLTSCAFPSCSAPASGQSTRETRAEHLPHCSSSSYLQGLLLHFLHVALKCPPDKKPSLPTPRSYFTF